MFGKHEAWKLQQARLGSKAFTGPQSGTVDNGICAGEDLRRASILPGTMVGGLCHSVRRLHCTLPVITLWQIETLVGFFAAEDMSDEDMQGSAKLSRTVFEEFPSCV